MFSSKHLASGGSHTNNLRGPYNPKVLPFGIIYPNHFALPLAGSFVRTCLPTRVNPSVPCSRRSRLAAAAGLRTSAPKMGDHLDGGAMPECTARVQKSA